MIFSRISTDVLEDAKYTAIPRDVADFSQKIGISGHENAKEWSCDSRLVLIKRLLTCFRRRPRRRSPLRSQWIEERKRVQNRGP